MIKKIALYFKTIKESPILRRYFVMNGFDGILTTLGILLAAILSRSENIPNIIFTVFSAGVAMGISGFWGAVLVELAERKRELKELERALFTNLSNTKLEERLKYASITAGIVDGFSPLLFSIICVIPLFSFFLFQTKPIFLLIVSYIFGTILLFILGAYLGRISRENWLLFGIKMASASLIVFVLVRLGKFIA